MPKLDAPLGDDENMESGVKKQQRGINCVLNYKIVKPIDIESLSDELAGYPSAIRVTGSATIEVVFEEPVTDKTRCHIDHVLVQLGAEPVE